MSTIRVAQKIEGAPDRVYKKVKRYCDRKLILKELGNLKPKILWDDEEKRGTFDERGVRGTLRVTESSSCKLTVTMDIPFFLLPFKALIQDSIQRHLEKLV